MEGAKNLEKSRRDLLKKIEQDKAAQADKERDLREANVAMEEAHTTVLAAQQAKRKQASLSNGREVLACLPCCPCPTHLICAAKHTVSLHVCYVVTRARACPSKLMMSA